MMRVFNDPSSASEQGRPGGRMVKRVGESIRTFTRRATRRLLMYRDIARRLVQSAGGNVTSRDKNCPGDQ